MPGSTDENTPVPGPAGPPDDADAVSISGDPDENDGARPCAFCGRPIPQLGDMAPPVRYCLDNDGACARAAADRHSRDQDSPGLTGQVARTWDMVERLEDVAELLAMSLTGAMSVTAVERSIAEARADAAAGIAYAQKDREIARQEMEQVVALIGPVRDRARRAEEEVARLTADLEAARADRETAREMGAQATRTAEAANAAIAAVREDQERLTRQLAELAPQLDAAREEAGRYREEAKAAQKRTLAAEEARSRLRATESELDKMRTTAEVAQNARSAAEQACVEADRQALEARSHAEEMSLEREAVKGELETCGKELETVRGELEAAKASLRELEGLAAELEESRARLLEQQLESREQAQTTDQLRAALARMISERDAARADADEAATRMSELAQGHFGTTSLQGRQDLGPSSAFPPSPPGHDLGGVTGPPERFRRRFRPPADD